MQEHDQDVEKSNIVNIGKENIGHLTDNRRQISCSNYSNENYCGNLKEEKVDSKLMTRIKETETKIFEKLENIYLLQMGLQDSYKKLNEKAIIILRDTNGIKHSERMENCSEYNYIGPISPLTLPPDIYATKLFSQQLTVKEAKSPKPTNISLLAFNSQYTMVRGNTKKIRKTNEEATFHEFEYKEQKSPEAKFVGINARLHPGHFWYGLSVPVEIFFAIFQVFWQYFKFFAIFQVFWQHFKIDSCMSINLVPCSINIKCIS